MIHYKDPTILTLSIIISSCNTYAAMQKKPIYEQKNEEQQALLLQETQETLKATLPCLIIAIIRGYLQTDYSPHYHTYQGYQTIVTDDKVLGYQWSGDGRHILTHHPTYATLWDLQTCKSVYKYTSNDQSAQLRYVSLQPHNLNLLMITGNDSQLQLHDYTEKKTRTLNRSCIFYNAIFNNHDGNTFFMHYTPKMIKQSGKIVGYIGCFDTNKQKLELHAVTYNNYKTQLTASSDKSRIASAIGNTIILSSQDLYQNILLRPHQAHISDISFSNNNQWVLTASHDNTARLFEAASGKQLRAFQHHDAVLSARFDPIDTMIITHCQDHRVRLFNLRKNIDKVFELSAANYLNSPTFSPDGKIIAGYSDNKIHLLKAPDKAPAEKVQSSKKPSSILKRKAQETLSLEALCHALPRLENND